MSLPEGTRLGAYEICRRSARAAWAIDGDYVWTLPAFGGRLYEVSPDGQRYLLLKDADPRDRAAEPTGITVVQNWAEELKRLLPPN
jgi:hypothetical protein